LTDEIARVQQLAVAGSSDDSADRYKTPAASTAGAIGWPAIVAIQGRWATSAVGR
jgi:hypothetical protein